MNPLTHLFVGWVALEKGVASMRDKTLVCVAGVAPDFDGLGIVVDFVTRHSDLADTDYYQDWHRLLGHGLPAALVVAGLAAAFGQQRWRVAALAFVAVHLHFLCDIVGSRGTTPADIWPIWYFEPLSPALELAWSRQWPLVGWQNMAISVVLMLLIAVRADRTGYSPVGMFSRRADAAFIAVLRKWKRQLHPLRKDPGMISRFAAQEPELATLFGRSTAAARKTAAFACARAALAENRLELPALTAAVAAGDAGALAAIVEALDEEYFALSDAAEEGNATAAQVDVLFCRARAASAMQFAVAGQFDESLYEALSSVDEPAHIRAAAVAALQAGVLN